MRINWRHYKSNIQFGVKRSLTVQGRSIDSSTPGFSWFLPYQGVRVFSCVLDFLRMFLDIVVWKVVWIEVLKRNAASDTHIIKGKAFFLELSSLHIWRLKSIEYVQVKSILEYLQIYHKQFALSKASFFSLFSSSPLHFNIKYWRQLTHIHFIIYCLSRDQAKRGNGNDLIKPHSHPNQIRDQGLYIIGNVNKTEIQHISNTCLRHSPTRPTPFDSDVEKPVDL